MPPLRKKLKRSKSPSEDEPKKKKQRKVGIKNSVDKSKNKVPQVYQNLLRKGHKLGRVAGGTVKSVNNAFKNPNDSKNRKRKAIPSKAVIDEESDEEEVIISGEESEYENDEDSKEDSDNEIDEVKEES